MDNNDDAKTGDLEYCEGGDCGIPLKHELAMLLLFLLLAGIVGYAMSLP